jgi:NADH:ubiquinone oxidoreductase subunit C|uniref:NADH-quinone oxidoreductase subunit C n=1 Tax=candidate division WOR-3 bacterium TaxID=2052148 RepID=A0A7V3PU81_UNCW3
MSESLRLLLERFPQSEVFEKNPRRLYIRIPAPQLTPVAKFLHKELGMRLSICTGIDTREGFEILYHFSEDNTGIIYTLKVLVPKDEPKVESLGTWFPAALWIEREMHELLGIDFIGHPNLIPLLTSDTNWESDRHPLRRDYERRNEAHER